MREIYEMGNGTPFTKYPTTKVESIREAAALATDNHFWVINNENDYTRSNIDFNWEPNEIERDYTHIFPSQHHSDGGTYFVSKETLPLKKFLFRDDFGATRSYSYPIYYVEHFTNGKAYKHSHCNIECIDSDRHELHILRTIGGAATVKDIHKNTVRAVNKATSKYIWVADSANGYGQFDFTWIPTNLNTNNIMWVFCNKWNKWGTTFFINVEEFHKYFAREEHKHSTLFEIAEQQIQFIPYVEKQTIVKVGVDQ